MGLKVLTNAQVEQFMEAGWVKLKEAYPREKALSAQQVLWEQVEKRGVLKKDTSTWTQQMVRINEGFDTPEFRECNTEKLQDAIEDLVGEYRWRNRGDTVNWGWWPVNFSLGGDKPWDVPSVGWHYDGQHFRHYVDSWEQGLLCLCIFSDVQPQGGGTVIAEGSHKVVAKILAQHPEGLEHGEAIRLAKHHPWLAELSGFNVQNQSEPIYSDGSHEAAASEEETNRIEKFMKNTFTDADGIKLRVVETSASAGDVLLCHPFLFHASAPNTIGVPRFMCNRTTPLKERMNLNRVNSEDYSPLELSIRKAIVESSESL
jgi:hypothetical protein